MIIFSSILQLLLFELCFASDDDCKSTLESQEKLSGMEIKHGATLKTAEVDWRGRIESGIQIYAAGLAVAAAAFSASVVGAPIGAALAIAAAAVAAVGAVFGKIWDIFNPPETQEEMEYRLTNEILAIVDKKLEEERKITNRQFAALELSHIRARLERDNYVCNKYNLALAEHINLTGNAETKTEDMLFSKFEVLVDLDNCDNFLFDTERAIINSGYLKDIYPLAAQSLFSRASFLYDIPSIRLFNKLSKARKRRFMQDLDNTLTLSRAIQCEYGKDKEYESYTPLEMQMCFVMAQMMFFNRSLYPYGRPNFYTDEQFTNKNESFSKNWHISVFKTPVKSDKSTTFANCIYGDVSKIEFDVFPRSFTNNLESVHQNFPNNLEHESESERYERRVNFEINFPSHSPDKFDLRIFEFTFEFTEQEDYKLNNETVIKGTLLKQYQADALGGLDLKFTIYDCGTFSRSSKSKWILSAADSSRNWGYEMLFHNN